MKFEKFVKTLASDGVIYECENGDRWLASPSVFMLIPPTIRSVTAIGIQDMPEKIDGIISSITSEPCELSRAIMPFPDSGIKDRIRVFSNQAGDIKIPIGNPDFALIEKSDSTEIYYQNVEGAHEVEPVALMVKSWPSLGADEPELIGLIFPTNYNL